MKINGCVAEIFRTKGSGIWSLPPDVPVYSAIEMMAEKGVGALLVVEDAELIGIISERDYARKVILKGRSSKDTSVRDIMTSPPLTVSSSCAIDEAMRIMTANRIRHLPVLDNGRLRGVVSIGDLVNWIITTQQETIGHLESYIAAS
jgi:CBS domain-containing protein